MLETINRQCGFQSPLRYPGGKQKAIKKIFPLFPTSAHEYREPMVGGGSIYFHARTMNFAKNYWINDKFEELISFWQTLQDPNVCAQLIHELKELHSQFASADAIKQFYLQARKENSTHRYRQAFLFFFFNRVTFSGTTKAGGFSSAASIQRFTTSSIDRLYSMPDALFQTKITNQDFEAVINAPGKDVFIFLDPPYFTASKLYGQDGSLHSFDHERLAYALKQTPHKFLLTYDDCEEIRKLYEWALTKKWSLQYGMNNCNVQKKSKIGAELFIFNYRIS